MTRLATRICLVIVAVLVGVILLSPVLVIVPMSFSGSAFLAFPPEGFSTQWYQALFSDPVWRDSTLNSLRVGVLSTAVSVVLGTCAAFGLVRGRLPFKGLLTGLVLAPLLVPYVVTGLAIYAVALKFELTETTLGFVLIHSALAVPYVVINVAAGLSAYDDQLDRAAQSLGARPLTTFRLVTFPVIAPSIYTGALFAFVTSWDEVVVGIFLSGPFMSTLPVEMWSGIRVQIDPTVGAVSSLLLLATGVVLGLAAAAKRVTVVRRKLRHRARQRQQAAVKAR